MEEPELLLSFMLPLISPQCYDKLLTRIVSFYWVWLIGKWSSQPEAPGASSNKVGRIFQAHV